MERRQHLRRDELFDVFSRERRRHALAALAAAGESLSLDELARAVAARERKEPADALDAADVERVRLSLHHCHVPKLAEAGLVTRDESGTISPTALAERVSADAGLRMQDGESNVSDPQ